MKVSVVIPCFNGMPHVISAVRSALSQGDDVVSIVVVDDGSSDGSARGVREAFSAEISSGILQVIRTENRGVSRARNLGLEITSGCVEAILFLDADDELEPRAVSTLVKALQADDSLAMVYGQAIAIDSNGTVLNEGALYRGHRESSGLFSLRKVENVGKVTSREMFYGNCATTPGQSLVRRNIVEKCGGFAPHLSGAADWDMWLRVSLEGTVLGIPDRVLRYRLHGDNMSANLAQMQADGYRMRTRWLRILPMRQLPHLLYAYCCRIVSRKFSME